jgi:hypothetical protein
VRRLQTFVVVFWLGLFLFLLVSGLYYAFFHQEVAWRVIGVCAVAVGAWSLHLFWKLWTVDRSQRPSGEMPDEVQREQR